MQAAAVEPDHDRCIMILNHWQRFWQIRVGGPDRKPAFVLPRPSHLRCASSIHDKNHLLTKWQRKLGALLRRLSRSAFNFVFKTVKLDSIWGRRWQDSMDRDIAILEEFKPPKYCSSRQLYSTSIYTSLLCHQFPCPITRSRFSACPVYMRILRNWCLCWCIFVDGDSAWAWAGVKHNQGLWSLHTFETCQCSFIQAITMATSFGPRRLRNGMTLFFWIQHTGRCAEFWGTNVLPNPSESLCRIYSHTELLQSRNFIWGGDIATSLHVQRSNALILMPSASSGYMFCTSTLSSSQEQWNENMGGISCCVAFDLTLTFLTIIQIPG